MNRVLLAAILLIVAVSAPSQAGCLDPKHASGETRSAVKTPKEIRQPYFYFRSMEYNYALMVAPDDFIAELKSRAASTPKPDTDLLQMVSKDLPLTVATDLFKYVINDNFQFGYIQDSLAALLEQGKVAVFNASTGLLSADIVMKRDNFSNGSARTFYAGGNLVFFQSDCTVD